MKKRERDEEKFFFFIVTPFSRRTVEGGPNCQQYFPSSSLARLMENNENLEHGGGVNVVVSQEKTSVVDTKQNPSKEHPFPHSL